MVNWSLDDGTGESVQPKRRRRSEVRRARNQNLSSNFIHSSTNGRVRKVINGEVVYVRIRRVVKPQA